MIVTIRVQTVSKRKESVSAKKHNTFWGWDNPTEATRMPIHHTQ